MILVDSSVWIDHLRKNNLSLVRLLEEGRVLCHAHIVGELAMGSLRNRRVILQSLRDLPQAPLATADEVLMMIERYKLHGLGLGYIDAHLLASTRLADAVFWTRDRRLHEVAEMQGLSF